uniref:E3 ubiquitin-protein ligase n=1 Tax=Cacopsylla melanoneura TaxID=428564 RepID=A0A8D9AGS5_9HEMI
MDESLGTDMDVEQQLPVFIQCSSSNVVNDWKQKFEAGTLSITDFKEHWKIWVPHLLSPEPKSSCLDWSFDEDKVQKVLFDSLEEFICDGLPEEIFQKVSQMDNPPSVCGRVFKMGEPTYNCRECGMDATCVLCVDCFKKSTHRHHKYKMGTSNAGGCCDCGDVEAWKKEPYCDVHIIGTQKRHEAGSILPPDLAERARLTFSSVLRYAYQLLTTDYGPGIPLDLKVPPEDVLQITYSHNSDNFCTVLYNDEFHTFEHVINTLVRSLKCSQKDAIEFVTNIDREGRAAVKCSNFSHCEDLKGEIERFTSRHGNRPIKVAVVNSVVVAHQIYAMRLLTWLQKLLGYSESFRILFSEVSLEEKSPDLSIVEGILIKDSQLWKAARLHWHRLFISGMLMEYESKKSFARVFTKKYGAIMKDFIRDDHDHSFSVGSMAVQIYTVPTLAHYLIASEDVLFILLSTFIAECTRKLNKKKKLEFERNLPNAHFKRAQYILYDLRYLLGVPPDTWTPELRQGFLHGLNFLLDLLSYMQGMDEVTRQIGQHMEYEPEWESAFNLHIKLAPVITLFLQWCGTDKEILVKAYRATMRQLCADESLDLGQLGEVREVGDHSVACLHYDVSTQPVSIHLPLSRFLAGLYIHLDKFGLSFNSPDLISDKILRLTPEQLIEPVLRTQVMISQVHAGMWRRNGYSLLNQIYFYHNVKCRNEMLDKDIILLQIGASLIESNEFLIHLLNKFNLINWVTPNFEQNSLKSPEEESIRQTTSLVEEFLHLLILITGERFMPGIGKVTSDDCIKKEVIQQLCIKPLPHSELNKALPDDSNHETGLERVINEIADFKKPVQSSGKGVYELKADLYERYNVFFYHYSREEVSRSEEEQRKRRKANKELECVPPPKLPAMQPSFSMVTNLLQCDVMLHIMSLVLERSINLRARSFSESQLHKMLHLIGYALHEEESGNYQFFMFTDRAEKFNLEQHIEELCTSPRVEAHKDLLTWTLAKFRSVSAPRRRAAQTESSLPSAGTDDSASTPDKAQNVAPVENEEESKARRAEKDRRAKLAAERRAKVMAQMQAQQNSFMKENAKMFEENASPAKQQELPVPDDQESSCMDVVENPVSLGPNQTPRPNSQPLYYTCILCQEEQALTKANDALVLAAFVQQSTVMFRNRSSDRADFKVNSLYISAEHQGPAPHTSTCGHVMHSSCWSKYFDNILAKENRRPYRLRQPTSFDIEKNEFLCPLCECLSNTALPLIPALSSIQTSTPTENAEVIVHMDFDAWLSIVEMVLEHKKRLKKVKSSSECQGSSSSKQPKISHDSGGEDQDLATPPSGSSGGDEGRGEASLLEVGDTPPASTGAGNDGGQASGGVGGGASTATTGDEGDDEDEEEEDVEMFPVEAEVVLPRFLASVEFLSDVAAMETVPTDNSEPTPSTSSSGGLATDSKGLLSASILDMVNLFSQATYTKGLDLNPHQGDPRVSLMTWKSCAYTIRSLEWQMRDLNKPLLGEFSSRQQDCLSGLVRVSSILSAISVKEQVVNSHATKLLSLILDAGSEGASCLLDWDPFSVLVPLTITLPSIFYSEDTTPIPLGTQLELQSLTLILIAHLAQIILTVKYEEPEFSMEDSTDPPATEDKDTSCLTEIVKILLGPSVDLPCPPSRFWSWVTSQASPFLRCCVIFYHFLTDIPAPMSLTTLGGDTWHNMCSYLGLPTGCDALLNTPGVIKLIRKWKANEKLKDKVVTQDRKPLEINKLINLPEDYSELINTVSLFTCPNSDREDSRNPALCLICGDMLCSQSYCCQTELFFKMSVGACTYHSHFCGAGVGVFLRVRECEVLFLASPNRGCFMSPPYLDDYGETDQGLRRGNPLRLCQDGYKKLQRLWLSHGIHEEISRSIEASHNMITTQWQHI